MESASTPNLRHIAKAAGVSHTTVSLALRNHPRVSAATRRRIQELAKKMGYHSNVLVSALMSHVRTQRRIVDQEVVGFLTGGPEPDAWKRRPNLALNYHGARERAEQIGLRLEPFWMGLGGKDAPRVAKILRARSIRGALLAPLPVPHAPEIALNWAECAVTTIGYSYVDRPLHRACHHHLDSMLMTYERLRQMGYRRIGLAMTLDDMVRVKYYWLAGLLTGRERLGGEAVPTITYHEATGKPRFLAWYRKHRPDVIVGIAWDSYYWLLEEGIRLPQDVAYAHLNLFDPLTGQVAGIKQRSWEIGAAAIDLLAHQLYHNEYGPPASPRSTLLDGEWLPGPTAPGRK